MTETFTNAEGLTLAYERRGEGPLLVCHPGGPGFSSRLFADAAGLDERLTLVLLDPRGTGGSGRPADPGAYATEDYVADLESLREHLGAETIDLLGFSHGGIVAMAYAAAYPQRLGRLVLAATAPRFGEEPRAAMQSALEERAGEPWYEDARRALEEEAAELATDVELAASFRRQAPLYFARFGERERAYLDELDGEANADALLLFNTSIVPRLDLRPDLALVDAPTLVLVGEDDVVCGPAAAEEIADGILGAEVVTLPAGHFLFVEQPERFRDAVWRFLEVA